MQAARQTVFDFGPRDHFEALHGGHRFPVAVCTKAGAEFRQHVYPHDDAAAMLVGLAGDDDHSTYFSQSGFSVAGGRRTVGEVRALTAWFVDLDAYKVPGLSGFDARQLLDAALALLSWLPLPTLLVESGRGAYFVWAFDRPVSADRLPDWQAVEDALVSALEPWGADRQARDAARVLRVAGSMHLVAGERVRAQRVGDAVNFDAMRGHVLKNAPVRPQEARQGRPTLRSVDGEGDGLRKRTGTALNDYRLARDRMADYATLAVLRGGDLGEFRHRLAYCYAQAASWFCGSVEQLRSELDAFAATHFRDAPRYRSKIVESVIQRFIDDGCGRIVRLPGVRDQGRYRFSNRYIVGTLGITLEEQQHLRTIISTAEKRRRETEKRRASGMRSRSEYLGRAAERRQEARRLRAEGITLSAIADRMGVSVRAVTGYLKD